MRARRPLLLQRFVHPRLAVQSRPFATAEHDGNLLEKLNTYSQAPPSRLAYERAADYISRGPISFLFSCSKLPNFPADSKNPEIAFLGRSNVGKSSLLNALLNRKNAKLAHESKTPGRTRTMNLYGVGGAAEGVKGRRVAKDGMSLDMLRQAGQKEVKKGSTVRNVIGQGGLVVVDCPGYGFGSRDEWGEVVIRYLQKREQLARAFLLVDVSVGLKKSDQQILEILRKAETPHQIVLSKVDKVLFPTGKLDTENLPRRVRELHARRDDIMKQVEENFVLHPDVLLTSSNGQKLGAYKRIGIQDLQYTVLKAAGLLGKGKEADTSAREDEETSEIHDIVSWDQLQMVNKAKTAAAG